MLSTGTAHRHIQRDRNKNLRQRIRILQACEHSPELQRGMMELCKNDVRLWVGLFVWQMNPKRVGVEVEPMIPWDFQDEGMLWMLKNYFEQEDGILEKSREMGATWFALIVIVWLCLFHDWKKFSALSHTETAVDRTADAGSLFWKVMFILEHLPDWMLRGMTLDKMKRKLGISFPVTNSSINGSASTTRTGVGGRDTGIMCDEFAKQKDAAEVYGQTADTGPRLFISTHYGTGTKYYELTKRDDIRKLIWHWSQHPAKNKGLYHSDVDGKITIIDKEWHEKNPGYKFVINGMPKGGPHPGIRSPWYDKEVVRRSNARDVAMHLDIDPEGSVAQVFDAAMIGSLIEHYCMEPIWEGLLAHDEKTGEPIEFVKATSGRLKMWIKPDHNGKIPRSQYVMGADLCTGTAKTPTCITVADARTGERVAEYVDANIDPTTAAYLGVALAKSFCDELGHGAFFCWEQQGPGIPFGNKVMELGYANYYRRTEEAPFSTKIRISDRPGWVASTTGVKEILLAEYETALRERRFVNRSRAALKQCLQFRYDDTGKPIHPGEKAGKDDPASTGHNHGDMVIADALAWKMIKLLGLKTEDNEVRPELKPGTIGYRRHQRSLQRNRTRGWE